MIKQSVRGRSILIAVPAGLGAGLLARLFFAALPEPWNTLANTSALWGLAPFFVARGLRVRGWASVTVGILSLVSMVAAWVLLSPAPPTLREVVMWAVVATAAGALCGLAGSLSGNDRSRPRRVGFAIAGGLVMGEGLYGMILIGGPQWWFELCVGVVLLLALPRRWADRLIAVAGASVIACALFSAYLLYDAIAVIG